MLCAQNWVYNEVIKPFIAELRCHFSNSPFQSAAPARDAGPPSQGHGWSPAALHQMPRCTADNHASIVPGQLSFSPEVDAELPVVPGA